MEWDELIESIYISDNYKSVCSRITTNKVLREELHSELILSLYNYKDEVFKAYTEGYIDVYIVSSIHNLWRKRYCVKKFKGSTSSLYMYADNHSNWYGYKEHLLSKDTARDMVKKSVNELAKKMKSSDENERLSSQLLWDVCKTNTHKVSKKNNTSDYQINRRISPILKDLKRKIDE